MNRPKFIHLGVHTEYSLYDSIVKVKDLVKKTKELGLNAVGISDDSNLFAAIKLYQAATSSGLKPIISSEVNIRYKDDIGKVTLIAKNKVGYTNLCNILSIGYEKGRTSNDAMPFVDFSDVQKFSSNLICLSGGRLGLIGKAILNNNIEKTREYTKLLRSEFDGDFYIELQRIGHSKDNEYNTKAVGIAVAASVPVVATNAVRFISPDGYGVHEIRIADSAGVTLDKYKSINAESYTPHQYLKSPDEMIELFSDIPSAIENTVIISEKCSVDIPFFLNALPSFPTPDGSKESEYLIAQSWEGLEARLKDLYPLTYNDPSVYKEYHDRLEFELEIINQMGFPGYFLIVADFIQWSKDNDIPVGPGRGSGAGSLVAYALKITDLDPLEYSLLFERFLNPERVSMPDFDIDFCMDKRDLVIKYCADKYGHKAVSQIITFGTLAAKAAIKTSARVQGFPYSYGDRLSKLIPNDPGIKLSAVMSTQDDFQIAYQSDLDSKKIIDAALALEGIVRQTGKHAGGVVISPSTITDFSPTYSEADGGGFVCQYDKNDIETAGLVKFDFLGLKTLTIVDNCVKFVNERLKRENKSLIDISKINLADPEVYKLYQEGETSAVFQVESRGMKELLKRLKGDRFEDIIALVALYRPGPLQSGMVDNFIDRKHGREEIAYPDATWQHESLKEILEPTYGIILYQEQVMQIAQVLAGYTLGGADMLRRAMGKKKPEEMAKQRQVFQDGAINNGIDGELSMKIFDLVEKFAGYGFNKSHSAAYALVSYQTAWLKTHYPAEFMAAVMSADIHNKDKVISYAQEAKKMGIKVLPPDINKSSIGFTPVNGNTIYFGLEAIASFGSSNIEPILKEREKNGLFKNMFDFASRCKIGKNPLTNCIYAGAFDAMGESRATLVNSIGLINDIGKQAKLEKESAQQSLFGSIVDDENIATYNHADDWSLREKLEKEIKAIGLSVSGHLLDDYEVECTRLTDGKLMDFIDTSLEDDESEHKVWNDKIVKIAGVLSNVNITTGQKGGQQRARMTFDDGTRFIECMAYNNVVYNSQQFMHENSTVIIKGNLKLNKKTNTYTLIAYELDSIDSLRQQNIESLQIKIDATKTEESKIKENLDRLKKYLDANGEKGTSQIVVEYIVKQGEKSLLPLGQEEYVISDHLIHNINLIFGKENVSCNYKELSSTGKKKSVVATKEQIEEGIKSRSKRHLKIENALSQALAEMTR